MPPETLIAGKAGAITTMIPPQRAPTGLRGFDGISGGEAPLSRSTLITGAARVGKTIFGPSFVVDGAMHHQESSLLRSRRLALESIQTRPNAMEARGLRLGWRHQAGAPGGSENLPPLPETVEVPWLTHARNEFPYLVNDHVFALMLITSIKLDDPTSSERILIGNPLLNAMLGSGLYRDLSVLISGNTNYGKTTLIASILCRTPLRGERFLLISSEESASQLIHEMALVSIRLQHWLDADLLMVWSEKPRSQGLEHRFRTLEQLLETFESRAVSAPTARPPWQAVNPTTAYSILVRDLKLMRGQGDHPVDKRPDGHRARAIQCDGNLSATQLKRLALEQCLLASQANQQLWMEQHRGEES